MYNIAVLSNGYDDGLNINVVKQISTEEYNQIIDDIRVIEQFRYVQTLMGIYIAVVNDIEGFVSDRNHVNLKWDPKIQRLFTEVGSVFYLFIEMLTVNINRKFGANSNESKLFDKCRKTEHTNCFEYRLMCGLRNLMIHSEFPPIKMLSKAEIVSKNIEYEHQLYIKSSDLLSLSYKWRTDVREYLSQVENIDVVELCKRVQQCLSDLACFYLNLFNVKEMFYSNNRLLRYAQYCKNDSDDMITFRFDDVQKVPSMNFQMQGLMYIPIKQAQIMQSMIKRR